jgi:hypothetical protein
VTLSVTWRSARKFPSNPLCIRAFARELQAALIGEVGKKPQYPEVERAFQKRTGAELGKATWSEWWNGRRVPNATYRTLIDTAFKNLASKWLYRSLEENRLQRYLSALDLGWLYDHESPDDAETEAWAFLMAVVHDWAPYPVEGTLFPEAVARGGLVGDRRRKKRPRPRQVIPLFHKRKGVAARLDLEVSRDTAILLEPLNPSSVLLYLLRYAAETQLPDPALKQAFILDFLTAVNACLCLLQMVAPHRPEHWGRPGQIALACDDLFWLPDLSRDDPFWELSEPFGQCIWPLLEEMKVGADLDKTRRLFYELKESYYASMAVTGLDAESVLDCVRDNLGCDVVVEYVGDAPGRVVQPESRGRGKSPAK